MKKLKVDNYCLIVAEDVSVRENALTTYVEGVSKCATRLISKGESESRVFGEDLFKSLLKSKYLRVVEV